MRILVQEDDISEEDKKVIAYYCVIDGQYIPLLGKTEEAWKQEVAPHVLFPECVEFDYE